MLLTVGIAACALAMVACGASGAQSSDAGTRMPEGGASGESDAADSGEHFGSDLDSGEYVYDASHPDGSVACGAPWRPAWCDPLTEYCLAGGLAPPGTGTCVALPSPCLVDQTCGCLADAGVQTVTLCGCTLEDSGILYSGCFCP